MNIAKSIKYRLDKWTRKPALAAAPTPVPCMHCGFSQALFLGTSVRPDFNVNDVLPAPLRAGFVERRDGICVRCGIYQAYGRFSDAQLRHMNYVGKDITTSEERFHSYPAPPDFVEHLNSLYFGLRTSRWREFFASRRFHPARAFFIRPFFGGSVKFLSAEYGAEVAGIDMSETCLRTVADAVPSFKSYRGAINGMLEGDFLQSGPYDAVFVFHTVTHACDVHEMLRQIRSLVKPGGCAVFTHEIVRKPSNPFHMLHLSEFQLTGLLRDHFARVERIDACDVAPPPFVSLYTAKGDSPDLVAWAE